MPTMFEYDSAQRAVVVGYGKGALRIVHADSAESAGDIPLGGAFLSHFNSNGLETGRS